MASLFRHGLIYGFQSRFKGDLITPMDAQRHIAIDFSNDERETRYRSALRDRLEDHKGMIPRSILIDHIEALKRFFWVEFFMQDDEPMRRRLGFLVRLIQSDDGALTAEASAWGMQVRNQKVEKILDMRIALSFSDDGQGFLHACPEVFEVGTLPSERMLTTDQARGDAYAATVDAIFALCAYEKGWFVTERAGSNQFSFSESRKAKAASGYIERKKALMALDVREVKAFITEPPEREWREFDPASLRSFQRHHGGVREHEVRPFTRYYKKSGKTVPVRAHKRGNPDLGSLVRMTRVEA